MPDQPLPQFPPFHEGCYCFRDAEAEAAIASGQPVRCGGGRPCACVEPVSCDAIWDNLFGEMLPGGNKRPRSQCASCSCACAILHAASAAATAAAAKIRRCCGGDCRCPAGLCRCPQEAVPVDTYACGALNQAISQRVDSALQMEPQPQPQPQPPQPPPLPPPPDLAAALQAFQPPPSMSSVELANVLHAALQGLPQSAVQQNVNPQTRPSDDLTGMQPLPPQPRSCCAPRVPLLAGPDVSVSAGMTTDFETPVQPLQSACCGTTTTSSPPMLQPARVADVIMPAQMNRGCESPPSARQSTTCGGTASSALPTVTEPTPSLQHSGESSRHSARTSRTKTVASVSHAKSFLGCTSSSKSEPAPKPDRERIFDCHLCDAAFKFKQNRDRHINEVHRGLRPHECDYPGCESAFKNLSGLKQHKKTVHEKARPFKCSLCDRAFGQRNHLSQHVLVVHEKVKRYPCSFCDMAFSNVGNRTQHTKRRHPNQVHRKENHPGRLNARGT